MLKVDMLFRQQTNSSAVVGRGSRVGGWSEGWYIDANPVTVDATINFLCQRRAALLTTAASIIGQRVRIIGGGSRTNNRTFPGSQTIQADIPQMAIQIAAGSKNKPNVRHFQLRGIPDARVVEGEYEPSAAMTGAFNAFFTTLDLDGWLFKARDLEKTKYKIATITTGGVVTIEGSITLGTGSYVRLLDAVDENGNSVSGRYFVSAAVAGSTFTLTGYEGAAATIGFVREDATVFAAVNSEACYVGRITTHKVGRDFFQYVGRASRRR